jgi:hypothetical protein
LPAKYAKRREKRNPPLSRLFANFAGKLFSAFSAVSALRILPGRQDAASTLAEPDPSKPVAFAKAFHDHLVTVFEKASLLAGW